MALMPMPVSPNNHLYTITDSANLPWHLLYLRMEQVLAGGCRLIQYRDKSTDKVRRLDEARQLLGLCRQYNARFIINDDAELAREVNADGVHLGQGDISIRQARDLLGPAAIIGATCHADLQLAAKALAEGADYIAFGRFFPSATKPGAPPAHISLLSDARHRWPDTCIVAIGGITRNNALKLIQHGANYVAICHDICHHTNPATYAGTFAKAQVTQLMRSL